MSALTYTKSGTKATTAAKLDKAVFAVEVKNHELLKSAYVAYLANGRTSAAQTKTRGLVSGGGRKPWKQKGTGRARFGSSRNPIWRGGGIAFGPTGEENYSHKLHTNAKRTAIRQALTLASDGKYLIVLEDFEAKQGKVAPTVKLLEKIGAKGNILLVLANKDESTDRATRNLQNLKVVQANYLNVYDLLNADSVIMTADALKAVHEWLRPAASSESPVASKKTQDSKLKTQNSVEAK
jgi:large subunit ribosomal protein L4